MLNIDFLSQIVIEGVDAAAFLQSQLTSDVTSVVTTQCSLSAYCNRQGYIEALLWLTKTETGFRILVPNDLSELVYQRFKKYGAFSKITVQLQPQCFTLITRPQDHLLSLENNQLSLAEPIAPWCLTLTTPVEFWRAYWMSHGIATLSQATTSLFRPHDVNLLEHGAVCMTKGCYPGQEIVARMHYLGKIKQRLQRLWLTTQQPLVAGNVLESITLVDAIGYDSGQWAVMGVMRDEIYQQLPITYDFGVIQTWPH